MLPKFQKKFNKASGTNVVEHASPSKSEESARYTDIRYILSIVIFVLLLLGIGISYAGNFYFQNQIEDSNTRLAQFSQDLNLNSVSLLLAFHTQVETLQWASNNRRGFSPLLDAISFLVIPGVRYTSADIELSPDNTYVVTINAIADSLPIYLRQIATLEEVEGVLSNIALNDYKIDRTPEGTIASFSLRKSIPVDTFLSSEFAVTTIDSNSFSDSEFTDDNSFSDSESTSTLSPQESDL